MRKPSISVCSSYAYCSSVWSEQDIIENRGYFCGICIFELGMSFCNLTKAFLCLLGPTHSILH